MRDPSESTFEPIQRFTDAVRYPLMGELPAARRYCRRSGDTPLKIAATPRIGNSLFRLRRARVDLRNIVEQAIRTAGSRMVERSHRLAIALPEAPVWLQADSGLLEQVFVNLLVNAARYTERGGHVRLSLQQVRNRIIVRVRDSGIGIEPRLLQHLFDFSTRTAVDIDPRDTSGPGIGLALVRYFVELHGGTVLAASAGAGKGSEFTVCLPVEASNA